jgi:hypothetical protein
MVDCRAFGFTDGAQAVNYITSHDVEGEWNMRLYDFLLRHGVTTDDAVYRRVKLAFVCLLTAVGIPMILAGEEFADEHERFDRNGQVDQDGGKQVDPVNYSRATEPARADVLAYVSRLVKLRSSHPALGMNDTAFLQTDLADGKRVIAWQRGDAANPVIVVANFSDWGTADPLAPNTSFPAGRRPLRDGNGRRSRKAARRRRPAGNRFSLGKQRSTGWRRRPDGASGWVCHVPFPSRPHCATIVRHVVGQTSGKAPGGLVPKDNNP